MRWPFGRKKRQLDFSAMQGLVKDVFQAAYYASTSNSATMDFSFASGVGFNTALLSDLDSLRNRIRYELRQSGIAKGMMRTYANSCIGTGPALSIMCDNEDWGEAVEASFADWSRQCEFLRGDSLAHMLHLGVRQFFPCGEYIAVSKVDQKADHPVKLKYLMIRPDRLAGACLLGKSSDVNIVGGIEVDADGRPVAYHISKSEPDIDMFSRLNVSGEYNRIDVENVIHVFYSEDPAQMRGEPWLAVALPDLHKLRRYDEATIAAAIVAAKFAMFITNTTDSASESYRRILPPGLMDIVDGMATVLPPGYKPDTVPPAHPSANSPEFRRGVIANAGSANGMPANVANLDSSNSSFASARYDGVSMELEEKVVRKFIESRHLRRVFHSFLTYAQSVGHLDPTPDCGFHLLWRWPQEERHTDPYKAANAAKIRMESGAATLGDIAIDSGKDPQEHYRQLKSEVERFRADGLTHPMDAKAQNKDAKNEEPDDSDDDSGKRTSDA